MQFLTSLALLASAVVASPIDLEARQSFSIMAIYKLKLTSKTYPSLNGKYLSTFNNTVGVYENHSPILVTTNELPNKNLELHIKDSLVDAVIYLQPSGSLAQTSMIKHNTAAPGPQPSDFQSFAMGPTSGDLHPLSVTSKSGQWLAFPGTDDQWSVSWLSSDIFFIETAQLVQVSLENYID